MLRTGSEYLERLAGSRLNRSRRGSDICAERDGRALTCYGSADAFAPEAVIPSLPVVWCCCAASATMRSTCSCW